MCVAVSMVEFHVNLPELAIPRVGNDTVTFLWNSVHCEQFKALRSPEQSNVWQVVLAEGSACHKDREGLAFDFVIRTYFGGII